MENSSHKNLEGILFLINFLLEKGYNKDNKILEFFQQRNFVEKIIFKFKKFLSKILLIKNLEITEYKQFLYSNQLIILLKILKSLLTAEIIFENLEKKKLIFNFMKIIISFKDLEFNTEKEAIILLSSMMLVERYYITLLLEDSIFSKILNNKIIEKIDRYIRMEYLYFFRNMFYNCTHNLANKLVNKEFFGVFVHLMSTVGDTFFIEIFLDALGYICNIDVNRKNSNFDLKILTIENNRNNFVDYFPQKINKNTIRKIFANMEGIELLQSFEIKYSGFICEKLVNLIKILESENDPNY